jgi:hypothetical protein
VAPAWTRPDDIRAALRRKWQSGALLTGFAAGAEWDPLGFPLRGPSSAEIGERLEEVQKWAGEWERAGRGPLRVEYKRIGGRMVGANKIPGRAWIDGYDQAWTLLGVRADVQLLVELTGLAQDSGLDEWVRLHPMKALRHADQWARLLAVVRWIESQQRPGMYVRQVDVPGVDTKFIEGHKGILADLLDVRLEPSRIDPAGADFAARYGFAGKPDYVRFRCTALVGTALAGFSELLVRTYELVGPPPGVTRAYVIENEITYLAFPLPADAMVIWGRGYAVPVLEQLRWLTNLDVVYWGDIDTHGFAILNRLRGKLPHARSMLMDRATLLAHRDHWVTEPSQSTVPLDLLDPAESALYRDLVTGVFGECVRLEQERVSFSAIEAALSPSRWGSV